MNSLELQNLLKSFQQSTTILNGQVRCRSKKVTQISKWLFLERNLKRQWRMCIIPNSEFELRNETKWISGAAVIGVMEAENVVMKIQCCPKADTMQVQCSEPNSSYCRAIFKILLVVAIENSKFKNSFGVNLSNTAKEMHKANFVYDSKRKYRSFQKALKCRSYQREMSISTVKCE